MAAATPHPINVDDLDPKFAEAVREREAGIRGTISMASANSNSMPSRAALQNVLSEMDRVGLEAHQKATDAVKEQLAFERRGWRKIFGGGPTTMLLPMMIPLLLMPLLMLAKNMGASREASHALVTLMPLMMPVIILPVFLTLFLAGRKRKRLATPVLRAMIPAVATTPGERSYAGAVVSLLDSQNEIGHESAREIIGSLNALLTGFRRLQDQHEMIDRAMNAQSLSEAEDERDRLREKLAGTRDSVAREALAESLSLCESRLERAESLSPIRERIEAQQETAMQVMASVRVALAGLPVATSGASRDMAVRGDAGDMQRSAVRESAMRLQKQTVAVEEAVQEVLRLQA